MALARHALVLFSRWRTLHSDGIILLNKQPSWFGSYLVLGDDVDIAVNHLVASEYQITCGRPSIPIGLLKIPAFSQHLF
jgi:hypothetical protein